jgi:hypothetical protein
VSARTARPSERGQTSLLIVGFALVAALLVAVVVDASAAYLRRQRLDSLADGASLAATEGVREEQIYLHGLGDRVELDPAEAQARVADYLRELGAFADYPGLTYRVRADADSVEVVVSAPLDLPLVPPGWESRSRVTGAATSLVQVGG